MNSSSSSNSCIINSLSVAEAAAMAHSVALTQSKAIKRSKHHTPKHSSNVKAAAAAGNRILNSPQLVGKSRGIARFSTTGNKHVVFTSEGTTTTATTATAITNTGAQSESSSDSDSSNASSAVHPIIASSGNDDELSSPSPFVLSDETPSPTASAASVSKDSATDDAVCAAVNTESQQQQQQQQQSLIHSKARSTTTIATTAAAAATAAADASSNENDQHQSIDADYNPWLFIKNLPPLTTVQHTRISTMLPPQSTTQFLSPRLTLALDLDETLVHCSVLPTADYEHTFDVTFNSTVHTVYMRVRPHVQRFLQQVSQWFEVVCFTASQQCYADTVLDILDSQHQYIHHRLYRDHCVLVNECNFIKDLSVLNRSAARVLLIDNSVQAFGYQLSSGIPITSWYDDSRDSELLMLLPFLGNLRKCQDVRPVIQQQFQLHTLVEQA